MSDSNQDPHGQENTSAVGGNNPLYGTQRGGGAPHVDIDGLGSANEGLTTDPDTEAVTAAFDAQGSGASSADGSGADAGGDAGANAAGGPDAIDLADMSGASRREPGR